MSDDHIDFSALQNLDNGAVRMEFRIKDASFYTKNADGTKNEFFVDSPWSAVPIFNPNMTCPACGTSPIGSNTAECDDCEDSRAGQCGHGSTVCSDCIQSWAMDYFFRVALVRDGEVSEWYALNGAPGYKPL